MKNKILSFSAILVIMATTVSLGTTTLASDPELILRMTGVAYTLGLGSIGLFFVGWVFPKEDK